MSILLQAVRCADLNVYHWLNGFAGRWFLDRIASHVLSNNLLKGVFFLAFYWYFWFQNGPDRERRRKAIIVVLLASLLTVVISRTIALATPFRLRPMYDPAVQHHPYSVSAIANLENWSAFPSDTAAYYFALACGIAWLKRRLAIPIMLYTAVVCLPRMYFGIHWASDIVVGAVLGVAVVWLSLRAEWLWTRPASRALAAVDASPPWFYAAAFFVSVELAATFANIVEPARAVAHLVRLAPRHESIGMLLIFAAIPVLAASATCIVMALRRHRETTGRATTIGCALQSLDDAGPGSPPTGCLIKIGSSLPAVPPIDLVESREDRQFGPTGKLKHAPQGTLRAWGYGQEGRPEGLPH